RTRNGTVRNTDSFFKDDTVETRKITLTPNLLRDDSNSSTTRSADTREGGGSMDGLEKQLAAGDKYPEKKKKDKKPGMLSGLFKRKDKKSDEKQNDLSRAPSDEPLQSPTERVFSPTNVGPDAPSRTSSKGKLQKQQQSSRSTSPEKVHRDDSPQQNIAPTPQQMVNGAVKPQIGPAVRPIEPQAAAETDKQPSLRIKPPENNSKLTDFTNKLRSPDEPKRQKVKKAKQRVELDDFDSPADEAEERAENPFADRDEEEMQSQDNEIKPRSRVESLIKEDDSSQPPPLVGDTSSQETRDSPISPDASPILQTAMLERPAGGLAPPQLSPDQYNPNSPTAPAPLQLRKPEPETLLPQESAPRHQYRNPPTPAAPPPPPPKSESPTSPGAGFESKASTPTSTWSDANLSRFYDTPEIRDMVVIVHNTSDLERLGPDHPAVMGIMQEERGRLDAMNKQLDDLMSGWM
ncbi:hypothetical protein LTS18_013355, partial [Coniosporium uncinatum]